MKKITLLSILFITFCLQSNAQVLDEGFNDASLPVDWTQEYVSGTEDWGTVTANGNSSITPRNGTRMAEFRTTTNGDRTRLITPALDISALTAPQLTFYYANVNWFGDIDELRIYYKNSAGGTWTQIGSDYDAEQTSWTEVVLTLPNASNDYYIAFEAKSEWARGLNLDDVLVNDVPTCLIPISLSATAISATTADISWTDGNTPAATDWEYVVQAQGTGEPAGSGIATTNSTTSVSSLIAATDYEFYVRADCGGGDYSSWAGPFNFATLCAVYTVPYSEGFESSYTNQTAVGGCLSQESTTGTQVWTANSSLTTYNRSPRTGSFNAYLRYSNEDWIFIPITLTGGTSYTADVYARQDGTGTANADVAISYGTTNTAAAMTDAIVAATGIDDNYQLITGTFTPASTGTYYVGIKGYMNGSPWYISLDDIAIYETPSCLAPTGLSAIATSPTTADISWTDGNTPAATDWEYAVQADGTGEPAGSGTATTNSTTSVSSLTAATDYEYYVRADCGGGDYSSWAGPFNFATPIANDNFGDAIAISCGNTITGSTTTATLDENDAPDTATVETDTSADTDSPNVWYSFTGSGSPQRVTLSTCTNTNYDSEILVFTGTSGSLTLIDDGYDECGGTFDYEAETSFTSDGTTTYYISIDGYNGDSGDFELSITCVDGTTYTYDSGWLPSDPVGSSLSIDELVINDGDAVISSNTECFGVTVNVGATLTVNTGITLTTVGSVTLESTSTSYSNLLLDGTISGTVNYKRHVNAYGTGITGSNDLISAPLSGQTFGTFATANSSNLLASGTLRAFAPYNTATEVYENYDTIINDATVISNGIGFRAATTPISSPLIFTGTARSTDLLDVAITDAGNAWNLIGNPFPSYIDFDTFFTLNKTEFDSGAEFQAIYGYDGEATNGWTVWNQATIDDTGIIERIAPGQGFFVKAKTSGGLVDFTTTMRATGSSDDFILGRNNQPNPNVALCKLNLSSATNNALTHIYFIEGTTRGLDVGYDAGSYFNNAGEFSIFSNLVENNTGVDMAIQTLPYNDFNNVTVPLGINAEAGAQLSISIDNTSSLPSNISVYLEDTEENTFTLLNGSNYTFTPSSALSGTGRFYIHYSSSVLSVDSNDIINNLNIYANNTAKQIVIQGLITENTTANLYDVQGRLVLAKELESNSDSNLIDTSLISSGVYIIRVFNNSNVKSQKLVIN